MSKRFASEVKSAVGTGQDRVLWDDQVRGFGCRITRGGSKLWVVSYRSPLGKYRRESLGGPDIVPLADARKAAKQILARVALGGDPWGERQAAKAQEAAHLTFAQVAAEWRAHGEDMGRWRPNTLRSIASVVDGVLLKEKWAQKPIEDVTTADIQGLVRRMKSAPTRANRCAKWAGAICTFAVNKLQILDANPCRGLDLHPEDARERTLQDGELRLLWEKFREMRAPWGAFFRLLTLTGVRQSELFSLRWSQVHLDEGAGVIVLEGRKAKGRETTKSKKSRLVHLSEFARAELVQMPKRNEWVFGRELNRNAMAPRWERACLAAGILDLTPHDLRRSKATLALNSDVGADVVSKMIGDTKEVMRKHYGRVTDPTVRAAEEVVQAQIVKDATAP